ncbi:NIPSNAP family containing protein [Paracidovorax avenae ATCC 19860]|uniref:NIPSNAP family containing protein n=1 Tax=Paracidovorax avenae (strain ATCC 19860 / DSM 7227 / CCUG 15838 / JCM 20985 / LMG 2117 / NCPPB 1011) TaxID=643561 RepID=F0Q5K1_PARA1|nr:MULTISPECIES: NIPSNAP family protein [Comamonadaceae]ADX45629.1 NIPSNAP family containing protein [Paracidovorax avenae ATCC 19860]AVS68097.1 NIPSNAP family protein [Paracidovorax avenae]AVS80886.1 NIPSNAP family protein [Paracidovorax avenae]MDA8448996.1 NIPSNAP family protein [Acidovorax sp. GBBC 3297]MDA8458916.1 NIPSNAP family protein [Acidovorax sp. GBBC 3333]
MIHEIRTYTLVPGGTREYLRLYNEAGREVQTRLLGGLVAVLTPESGDLNQLIYHWVFDSYEERVRRRAQLIADPAFTEFRKSVRHLLVSQDSRLLSPA